MGRLIENSGRRKNSIRGASKLEKQSRKVIRQKTARKYFRVISIYSFIIIVTGSLIWSLTYEKWFKESAFVAYITSTTNRIVSNYSKHAGLVIKEVTIEGRNKAPISDVKTAIAIKSGESMLMTDIAQIKSNLEQIGWIKEARVTRIFPDTIQISVTERTPLALWRSKGKLYLIDREGKIISDSGISDYPDLPVLIGENAPESSYSALRILSNEPELFSRVSSVVMAGGRRWNVKFYNGLEVKLPEDNPEKAWKYLAELQKTKQIIDRNILSLDLRIPDRIFIRLPEEEIDRINGKPRKSEEDT